MNQSRADNLFYIYTPSWRENAAGIRVLHYLCDSLNSIGCSAFLVLHNPYESTTKTNRELNTPILSQELADLHFKDGKIPTVIYSETIPGNPLGASQIVRYLLNYVGVLGGPLSFGEDELLVSYTRTIQEATSQASSILFLPAVKRDELPQVPLKNPNLNLMYAGKYRAFVGKPPELPNIEVKEIYRDGPMKQSRREVLSLLAEANSIYLWENSTIATEAILLGTPCIFMENDFLGSVIAGYELGLEGTTFSNTQDGIASARNSLEIGKQKYIAAEEKFWDQLNVFIQHHNQHFLESPGRPQRIRIPKSKNVVNRHRVRLFFGMLRTIGIRKTLRVAMEFGRIRFSSKNR
jgi:hypothetical protein